MLRRLAPALVLLAVLCTSVLAVPTLQTFSPQGSYDSVTESWVVSTDPFGLWVVGAQTPDWVQSITDVSLLVAVSAEFWDPAAVVNIKAISSPSALSPDVNPVSLDVTLTAANLTSVDGGGNPVPGSPGDYGLYSNFPGHDLYPAYFWAVSLPDLLVDFAQEDVYDFGPGFDIDNPGPPQDVGDVQYYQVAYAPYSADFMLHFDLIGLALDQKMCCMKSRFAPFSHDTIAVVPEPGTILLTGLALAGLGVGRLKRRRRKA